MRDFYFLPAEGYVKALPTYDRTGGVAFYQFKYVYNYTDHLGNIRMSYAWDADIQGVNTLEENHYYPFGLKHGSYNETKKEFALELDPVLNGKFRLVQVANSGYQYQYNGKEWQDELGLDWYDYGARNYDASLGRWMNLDPLAEQYRRWSPYTYGVNNPIFFTDPDGMSVDPIYDLQGNLIGDDGEEEGKIHIVYNKEQAKEINNTTETSNSCIDLTGKDYVTLNGGETTVNGVVASVDAQVKDTSKGAKDAGLHEEGGHSETDANGNISAVAWVPGSKKSLTGHGTINLFNGVARPSTGSLLDYWHVHTSKTQEVEQSDGTVKTYTPSMDPSKPTTDRPGDIGTAKNIENQGYKATSIQVGTSSGKVVNFYNGQKVITSMNYNNFKKLK